MSHLNVLATVHLPVTAVGRALRNSFGVTVATCEDSFTAEALAKLVNWGQEGAEREEAAWEKQEAARFKLLRKRLPL